MQAKRVHSDSILVYATPLIESRSVLSPALKFNQALIAVIPDAAKETAKSALATLEEQVVSDWSPLAALLQRLSGIDWTKSDFTALSLESTESLHSYHIYLIAEALWLSLLFKEFYGLVPMKVVSARDKERQQFIQQVMYYFEAFNEIYKALALDKGSVKSFFSAEERKVASVEVKAKASGFMHNFLSGLAHFFGEAAEAVVDQVEELMQPMCAAMVDRQAAPTPGEQIKKLQDLFGSFNATVSHSLTEWGSLAFHPVMIKAVQRYQLMNSFLKYLATQPGAKHQLATIRALPRLEDRYYASLQYVQNSVFADTPLASLNIKELSANKLMMALVEAGPMVVKSFVGSGFHNSPAKLMKNPIEGLPIWGWNKDTFVGEEAIKAHRYLPKEVIVIGVSLKTHPGASQEIVYFVDVEYPEKICAVSFKSFVERMELAEAMYPCLLSGQNFYSPMAERANAKLAAAEEDAILESVVKATWAEHEKEEARRQKMLFAPSASGAAAPKSAVVFTTKEEAILQSVLAEF